MKFDQGLQHSGRARIFALLALLFVLGLQSFEVAHNHALHEGALECLSCQSSSAGVVAVAPEPLSVEYRAEVPFAEEPASPFAGQFSLYDSRGPPHFS